MSAVDWLLHSENDLKTAKAVIKEGITNNACFHAHQTVEKCLKAVILLNENEIPKVHDLPFLVGKARKYEPEVSQFEQACRFLNQFYISTRYPDAFPGSVAEGFPSKQDAQKAIEFAEEIFNFVKSKMENNK